MLSEESERVLSELLMKIIEGERKVEILRKCLCENFDFCPKFLFDSLCKVYPDSLLPKDLKEFLEANKELVEDQDVYLLVRQYSALQNGRLSLEDFYQLVISSTQDSLASLVKQRFHTREIKTGVKYSFVSLLKEELKLQHAIEGLKIKLFQNPEFSLWKAFESLNSAGKGFISEEDVVAFLKKHRFYISQQEYDALMRRIDLEDDLRISYNEFLEALIPLQVPKRQEPEKTDKKNEEIRNFESDFDENKKTEDNPKSFENEQQGFSSNEDLKGADLEDEPIVSQDLEKSPRFRETNEFPDENYETPEKSKSFISRQSSKTKNNEIDKISELLILQLENERKLEHARQNLLMQENFSLTKAFNLISEENGLIAYKNLKKFFNEQSIQVTSNVIQAIIQEFGENESLSPDGLLRILLPRDPDYSSLLSEESEEPLVSSTIDKIREVFEILVSNEQDLEDFKLKLAGLSEEELKDLFGSLDTDDDGEISSEDLKSFFKKIGRNVSERDRQGIIEKYSHGNQSIYFVEFKKLITGN